jgi:CubicO group peptidase (beta-lactamase class C family)
VTYVYSLIMDRRRFVALALASGAGAGLASMGAGEQVQAGEQTQAAAFPYFNRRIPDEAHSKMGELAPQGITAFAFTPANGWVIVTQTGASFARNIPAECYTALGQLIAAGTRIHCVAFPPAGGNSWVITGHNTYASRNLPAECASQIAQYYAAGEQVVDVAFPPGGANSWTVVSTAGFTARNIDDECFQMMRNLTQGSRQIGRVAFAYTGGWTIIAQDHFFARNIDNECFTQLNSFAAGQWQVHNLAFSPVSNGWSISSRGALPILPPDPARQVERAVGGGAGIWNRMAATGTPGVAIACVVNNQVAWATGYGWLEAGQPGAVHPETAFQAASISKAVASVGILRLSQTSGGALPLSADVRPHLGWTMGRRACVPAAGVPTIDRLLAHRSGVTGRGSTFPLNVCGGFDPNGGGGFAGYGPNAAVPTLLQVLNGQGNSPRAELSTNPGAAYYYSGAGFTVLQRMLEQRTGQSLAHYMAGEVFGPLGMRNSSYELSPAFELAAGHTTAGSVIPGRRNRYPESAAAGLYTNVFDLSTLMSYLNRAWSAPGDLPGPLSRASVQTLLSPGPTPDMGRGFFLSAPGTPNFSYSHNGSNYGFKTEFRGYPAKAAGYAILTNGDNFGLVTEIANAIKSVYALP